MATKQYIIVKVDGNERMTKAIGPKAACRELYGVVYGPNEATYCELGPRSPKYLSQKALAELKAPDKWLPMPGGARSSTVPVPLSEDKRKFTRGDRNNQAVCGFCFRTMHLTADGLFPQHNHSPLVAGALCAGGGKDPVSTERLAKVKEAPAAKPKQVEVKAELHELVVRNLRHTAEEYGHLSERLAMLNDKPGAMVYAEVSAAIRAILEVHGVK